MYAQKRRPRQPVESEFECESVSESALEFEFEFGDECQGEGELLRRGGLLGVSPRLVDHPPLTPPAPPRPPLPAASQRARQSGGARRRVRQAEVARMSGSPIRLTQAPRAAPVWPTRVGHAPRDGVP